MQSNIPPRYFVVDLKNLEILVAEATGSLRILMTHPDSLSLAQQTYTEANIGTVVGGQFKRTTELYGHLQALKNYPDRWLVNELTNLQVVRSQTQVVKIALKVVTDTGELAKLLLFKMSKQKDAKEIPQAADTNELKQEIAVLKSNYSSIGPKLKGIGELFETLKAGQDKTAQKLDDQCMKREELQAKISSYQQRTVDSLKKLGFDFDILEKTMHRNQITQRADLQTISAEIGKKIAAIEQQIEEYEFPKMRIDMDNILNMFELEIKVRDHEFLPEMGLQRGSKKLHWLNKRTLKNLEDVKDYNKVAGSALPKGISKLRFQVNVIKNNGLLLGVCNSKGRDSLQNCAFNDQNFITLNSCGYVTNRGAMHMSNAKIKSKDIVKMIVNLSQGIIRWFCNDIEVAIADMGSMNKEQVFPMVGLGFFGDQVQVLQAQKPKESLQIHQSYTHQLQRLNQKFGKTRSSRE